MNELTTNADDASIVRAVITLGKSLQIRVVAEGVESAAQLTKLQDYQCPEGQGHHFGRAVAGDELVQVLSRIVADVRAFAEGPAGEVPALHMAAKRMKNSAKNSARRNTRN